MLRTISKYTFRTLLRRRKSLFAAVTTIALCISLSFIIINTAFSMNLSYNKYISENYGEYIGLMTINSAAEEDLNEIQKEVEISGYVYTIGSISSDKSIYDEQLSVGYVSGIENGNTHISLLEGRLPQNINEIIVEKSLGEKLVIDLSIDNIVSLNIVNLSGETYKETFKVVGIINDYAALPEMKKDGAVIWPSVLVSNEYIAKCENVLKHAIISNVSAKKMTQVATTYNLESYVNPVYSKDSILYIVSGSTAAILGILSVCALLIAIICVYAYLMVSEPELTEHYKNLKLIGAGRREIVLFTILRTVLIYLISLVFGLLLGFFGSYAIGKLIIEEFIDIYDNSFGFESGLLGSIFPLLIIVTTTIIRLIAVLNKKPLQVKISQTNHQERKIKINNILSKWSVISLLNSKKTYIGIAFAMSICYLAVFVGVMFNSTIRGEYEKEYHDDYSIMVHDGNFATSFEIPIFPYYGVTDNIVDEIQKSSESSRVSTIKELTAIVEEPTNDPKYKSFYKESAREYSIDKGDFDLITEEFNLSRESEYYKTRVLEVDDYLLDALIGSKNILGNPNVDGLKTGKEVIIVCSNIDICPYKPGDRINLFQALTKDSNYFSLTDCIFFNCNVLITAVVQIDESESYLGEKFFTRNGMKCIWGSGSFEKNNADLNNRYIYLDLLNIEEHQKIDEVLMKIKAAYSNARITSAVDAEVEKEALLNSINLAVVSIAMFICAVCLFIYINIIKSKYLAQKRLWGVLRTIGIQKNTIIFNHIKETFFVFLLAIGLNLLFIGFVSILPIRKDYPLISYQLLAVYFISTLLAIIGTLPTVIDLFKKRIIEQLEYLE